jgi:transposase
VHLGETTPGDFANDLRQPPWIRRQHAIFSSFVARAICVISPHAEYSTKIHVACDGVGKPVKIILTPGQDHDVTQGPALIANVDADKVIADKAYDSDPFIETIESQEAEAVIPPRSNRTEQRSYDKEEYKKRNVVERFMNLIKQNRRVATRYEKTARNFLAMVQLASIFVLLN